MRNKVPARCIFLGEINSELDHSPGLEWDVEDYYYLTPWEGPEYDWALIRITWDDNWGNFGWSAEARIKGAADHKTAARKLFRALMKSWEHDLKKKEYATYMDLLKSI